MGTGTGILAILASMRGASSVVGIEIDEDAYLNAVENVALNHVENVELLHGDASKLEGLEPADFLLANINRNVIVADIDKYVAALKVGGVLMLSGFYEEDVEIVQSAASKCGCVKVVNEVKNRWTMLKLVRSISKKYDE